MIRTEAENLGRDLVRVGILNNATVGHNEAKATIERHGSMTIEGHWAGRESHAGIACPMVAMALLLAGKWTPDAIRVCTHFAEAVWIKPKAKAVTVARRCPCPVHTGGVCNG